MPGGTSGYISVLKPGEAYLKQQYLNLRAATG